MTEPADVAVIIPAWRAGATIGRALASVAAQTVPPRLAVVVDDGSDDDTVARAEDWRDRLGPTRLVVLRQANAGAGAARNRAIAAADTSWLAFLDADDEWLPGKLAASLAALAEAPDLAFAGHDMIVRAADGTETMFDCARHFRAAADPFAALFLRGFVATSTVVARRDAVVAAGGFETSLRAGQDYDLWLAIAGRHPFRVFPGALTRYHLTPGSITTQVERRRRASLSVMRRHGATLSGLVARPRWFVLLRTLIIHWEALNAHRARRAWGSAAFTVLRAAFEAVRQPLAPLGPVARRDHLAEKTP